MTPEQIGIITQILGYMVLLTALISMQIKKMAYLVIWQCMSNVCVVAQFSLRGEFSATATCAIASVETLIIFLYSRKDKKFPIWLTAVFTVSAIACVIALAINRGYFDPISDTVPILATVLFNVAMIMTRSSIARILMLSNSLLWLLLNLIKFDTSLVITYSVLVAFTVVGIVRLDRKDWAAFFKRLFKKEKNKSEI